MKEFENFLSLFSSMTNVPKRILQSFYDFIIIKSARSLKEKGKINFPGFASITIYTKKKTRRKINGELIEVPEKKGIKIVFSKIFLKEVFHVNDK